MCINSVPSQLLCGFMCINSQASLSKTCISLNKYFRDENMHLIYYVADHKVISFDVNISIGKLHCILKSLQPSEHKFIKIMFVGTVSFDDLAFMQVVNARNCHEILIPKPDQPYVSLFDSTIDSCKFLESVSIWFYIMTNLLQPMGIVVFPPLLTLPLRVLVVNLYRYFRWCAKYQVAIHVPKSIIFQHSSTMHEDTRMAKNVETDSHELMITKEMMEEMKTFEHIIEIFGEGISNFIPYVISLFNYGTKRVFYTRELPVANPATDKRAVCYDIALLLFGNGIQMKHVIIKQNRLYYQFNKYNLSGYKSMIEHRFDENPRPTIFELYLVHLDWVNLLKCSFINLYDLRLYNSKKIYDAVLMRRYNLERKQIFRDVYIGEKIGRVGYFDKKRKRRCGNVLCNLPNPFPDVRFRTCSRCGVHVYCSKKCQKIAWMLSHRYHCVFSS
eukprot:306541_1